MIRLTPTWSISFTCARSPTAQAARSRCPRRNLWWKNQISQIEQGFEKNLLPRSLQIDWQSVRKLSVTPCQWCQGIEDISAMMLDMLPEKLDMLPKELDMLPEEEERGKTKTTRGILKSSQLRGWIRNDERKRFENDLKKVKVILIKCFKIGLSNGFDKTLLFCQNVENKS